MTADLRETASPSPSVFQKHPRTCHDALAGHQHDRGEAHAEDGALSEVEHGQGGRGLERGRLVHLQVTVVPLRLVLLVVEVLVGKRKREVCYFFFIN